MARARRRRAGQLVRRLLGHPSFVIGAVILAVFIFVAVFAPLLAPYDPNKSNYRFVLMPPSAEFWFGTDGYGRDILSRVIYGTRVSLRIGAHGGDRHRRLRDDPRHAGELRTLARRPASCAGSTG